MDTRLNKIYLIAVWMIFVLLTPTATYAQSTDFPDFKFETVGESHEEYIALRESHSDAVDIPYEGEFSSTMSLLCFRDTDRDKAEFYLDGKLVDLEKEGVDLDNQVWCVEKIDGSTFTGSGNRNEESGDGFYIPSSPPPPPPECISIASAPASGSEIPASGQDVTATITGQNADQYQIIDSSGNVVAGPSDSNVLPFPAMPNADYQGQVRSDTHNEWESAPACQLSFAETPPPPPACISVVSVPENGSNISPNGQNVTATITDENANQYRIVEVASGNVVAGPSASNELPFMAMPNVDYQGQVRSDTHAWTNTGCTLRYR